MGAEDMVLGPAFHLLMYGDKIIANETSMLGNIGYMSDPWMLKDFAKHWNFDVKFVHKGKNKVRLNRFEEFKEEDIAWLKNIMNMRVDQTVSHILEKRQSKLASVELMIPMLKDGNIYTGTKSRDLGLIDETITADEYFFREYKANEISLMSKNWKQRIGL